MTWMWTGLGVIVLIVWVLTIVDIIRRGYSGGTTAGYIALIVILPLIGSAIYWAVRKPSAAEVERRTARRRTSGAPAYSRRSGAVDA